MVFLGWLELNLAFVFDFATFFLQIKKIKSKRIKLEGSFKGLQLKQTKAVYSYNSQDG